MKLPASLRWIEADLPGIIQYKTEKLALEKPVCRLERHTVDLSDDPARRTFLDSVNVEAEKTLVITEGLLGYLSPENVSALACELFNQSSFAWWLMDVVGPKFFASVRELWAQQPLQDSVQFKFAPPEGARFFEPFGWRIEEFRSFEAEGQLIHREAPRDAMEASENFREGTRESGIALLKSGPKRTWMEESSTRGN